MPAKPSVLVVENQRQMASILASTWEAAGASVLGPVGTCRDAKTTFEQNHVDYVSLDLNLPDGSALNLIDVFCGKPIIVITDDITPGHRSTLRIKCPSMIAYLHKDKDDIEAEKFRAILEGKLHLKLPELSLEEKAFRNLSVIQQAIFESLGKGKSNKELSADYNLSISTIRHHIGQIALQFGVAPHNLPQLAVRLGYARLQDIQKD